MVCYKTQMIRWHNNGKPIWSDMSLILCSYFTARACFFYTAHPESFNPKLSEFLLNLNDSNFNLIKEKQLWRYKKYIYIISVKGCLKQVCAAVMRIMLSTLQYSIILLRLILGGKKPDYLLEWIFWGCLEGSWSSWARKEISVLTSNSDSWYSFLVQQDPSSVFTHKVNGWPLLFQRDFKDRLHSIPISVTISLGNSTQRTSQHVTPVLDLFQPKHIISEVHTCQLLPNACPLKLRNASSSTRAHENP